MVWEGITLAASTEEAGRHDLAFLAALFPEENPSMALSSASSDSKNKSNNHSNSLSDSQKLSPNFCQLDKKTRPK